MIEPLTWTVMVVVFLGVYACFITWAYMTSYGKTGPKPDEVLEIHPALRFFDAVVADYNHTSLSPTVVSQYKMEIAMAAFALARKDIEVVTKNLASQEPPLIGLVEAFEVTHAFQKLSGTLANYGLPPVFKKKD